MKFYNPFKPHIVVDGLGVYRIRKWLFNWVYLTCGNNWLPKIYLGVETFCSYVTAKNSMESYVILKTREKIEEKLKQKEKAVHG